MSPPLVSILIPAYNQASSLPAAIESALAQDYSSIEVIVADDHSTDSTAQVIQKYLLDPRVRYEPSVANLGRVANYRRCVMELARGAWMINLDGDDRFTNSSYLSQAMALAQSDSEIVLVFGRQRYHDLRTGKTIERPGPDLPAVNDGRALLQKYFSLREGIPHLSAVYRVDVARRAGLFTNDIIYADAEAMLRLLPFGKVGYTGEFAGVWNDHGGNDSHLPQIEARLSNLKMITEPAVFFLETGLLSPEQVHLWRKRSLDRAIREGIYFYLDRGSYSCAWIFFRRAASEFGPLAKLRLWLEIRVLVRLIFPRFAAWKRRLQRIRT